MFLGTKLLGVALIQQGICTLPESQYALSMWKLNWIETCWYNLTNLIWYLGNLGVLWVISIEICSFQLLTFPALAAIRTPIIATTDWALCLPCARHFASVISFISNHHFVRPRQWLSMGYTRLLKHTSSNPSVYLLIRLIGPALKNAVWKHFFEIYDLYSDLSHPLASHLRKGTKPEMRNRLWEQKETSLKVMSTFDFVLSSWFF